MTTLIERTISCFFILLFALLDEAKVAHRPRSLSDNGPSYVSGKLAVLVSQSIVAIHIVSRCRATKSSRVTRGTALIISRTT